MAFRTVFVGGVHGVGKSHFCRSLVGKFDVEHVTASSLISRYIKHSGDKTVSNVKENQLILASELSRYKTKSRTILLDGHFCLLNESLGINNVPLDTFKAIAPQAIVLLKDDPVSIVSRLSNRDSHSYSVDLIASLQAREIKHANLVSQSLGIPLKVIEPIINLNELLKEIVIYL